LKLAVIPVLVVAGAGAIGALLAFDRRNDTASASRRPALPPGEPVLLPLTGIAERVDVEKMVSRAELVFVGEVVDVGGSEVVTPGGGVGEPFLLTRHRARFDVTKTFEGQDSDWIDISVLDIPEANVDVEVGRKYLVFARRAELGTNRMPAVIPDGYSQGVYAVVADDIAANPVNGAVRLSQLEERLR
jgi:hypothetical protein